MTVIESTWKAYHQARARGDGQFYRNLLLEHYRDVVRYVAERLHKHLPDKVELDDLISAGIFGLMDAIDNYDPTRGVKFETYCGPRIKGSILDELRNMDWVPRIVRTNSRELSRATKSLEMKLGRKPNDEELRMELGMDEEEYKKMRGDAAVPSLTSIDQEILNETLTNKNQDTVSEVQKRELKEILLKGLSRHERLIVILYYYENMNTYEIADVVGVCQPRVHQLHKGAIAKLKKRFRIKGWLTPRNENVDS